MRLLATIAARQGSKGVKNKNIRLLAGKPLVLHTIEQARRWGRYERLIVSTDGEEIARVARSGGAEVPFLRPPDLATDTCAKMPVLRHALKQAEQHFATRFDAVLDLDATSPVRTVQDIEGIVQVFAERKPDCAFSVVRARKNPYFNMVELTEEGLARVCKVPPAGVVRRQDAPPVFEMNASMYVYDRNFLLDERYWTPLNGRAAIYPMPEYSAFDIDNEVDFQFVEFLVKEGLISL
jgi:CMP-N,N'-diacetyllegionaminic acid synthase